MRTILQFLRCLSVVAPLAGVFGCVQPKMPPGWPAGEARPINTAPVPRTAR